MPKVFRMNSGSIPGLHPCSGARDPQVSIYSTAGRLLHAQSPRVVAQRRHRSYLAPPVNTHDRAYSSTSTTRRVQVAYCAAQCGLVCAFSAPKTAFGVAGVARHSVTCVKSSPHLVSFPGDRPLPHEFAAASLYTWGNPAEFKTSPMSPAVLATPHGYLPL